MQPVDPNRVAGLKDQDEFSLVLGGPLYQLLRKARLEGDAAGLVRRRISVMVLLTWLPLLLLSMVEGHAWGETRSLSFLAPGGFVQLFADENGGANHVDFKLTAAGSSLSLHDSAATLIESVNYGAQPEAITQGRLPNGGATITRARSRA